jgi:glycosyltransferase involved in cell wall biosynthesis
MILCGSFPPETGAAPGRLFHLAKLLQSNGYSVQVITMLPNYPLGKVFSGYQGKWSVSEMQEGIPVTRLWFVPTNSSSKWRRALSLMSLAATLKCQLPSLLKAAKPDLIYISSPPFLLGSLGSKIAQKLGIPLLLNISDLWPGSAEDLGFLKEGRLLHYLRKKEREMYQLASAISAQSAEIETHILRQIGSKPTFLYRNLQPLSKYAGLPRPDGRRKIVYAGLLGIAQGVAGIAAHVDFAAYGTELHIYGSGNELDKIKELAASRSDIIYHGSIAAAAIPEQMSRYHIMLVPLVTKIEGAVPSKIFNAVANGLPILYMGSGESASIISQYNLGYAGPAGDIEALKENLAKLMNLDEEQYAALRTSCTRAAETTFNKEQQDRAFLLFLNAVFR